MVKIKVTAVTSLPNSEMVDRVENTVSLMTGDPTFPTPTPSLSVISDAAETLEALEQESLNGNHATMAEKKTARGALVQLFTELCLYIQYILRNNPNAENIIISKGLEPAKTGGHRVPSVDAPFNLQSSVSQTPGCVELEWNAGMRGVHGFLIEYALGGNVPEADFKPYASCTMRKFKAQGLERGQFYSFRIRCVAAGGTYSAPSEVTVCIAG